MSEPRIIAQIGNYLPRFSTENHVAASAELAGHTVVRIQESTVDWTTLADDVLSAGADLLLWTRTWSTPRALAEPVLEKLAASGVPSAGLHLDRWWDLDREHQVYDEGFFATTRTYTADGGHDDRWAEAGIDHRWLPPGVFGPEAALTGRPNRFTADVCFVGSHPYPHAEWEPMRTRMIDTLTRHYGRRFRLWPRGRQAIRGRNLNDLYASTKVVVGDSCLVPRRDGQPARAYWSDRVPETLGRGGVLVHPWVEGLDDLYPPDVLATYPLGDMDALVAVVDELLADDERRASMRARARALVAGRDTYEHRITTLLDDMLSGAGTNWYDTTSGEVEVRRHGVAGRFDLRPGTQDALVVREVWLENVYRLTREQVAGGLVVDCGANIGAFSVLAALLGARRVLAFEPHPESYARLESNVALSGVADVVAPYALALTDTRHREPRELVTAGASSYLVPISATTRTDSLTVPTWNLPAALAEACLDGVLTSGTEEIALLHVDVEGSEFEMLDSLARVLDHTRRLVMEFHGPEMDGLGHLDPDRFGELATLLAERGHLEVLGRPSTGGMMWWERYGGVA